ncbi:sulfatase [Tichowtungia aerotolerans]|uniref:Sulfatase-like hydrolase/transferase n=1 Tax=Tichowtungia aerotolerans TaxID=2697043 RepID=A0A6P1MAG2_9BACT|nr:sulfatase [Tichowtungia aerotolerans]QHI69088.1 sulfatase-like hydrolase/transferase [Tichowtungia aerotolerans]
MKKILTLMALFLTALCTQAAISIIDTNTGGFSSGTGAVTGSVSTAVSLQEGDVIVVSAATNKKGDVSPITLVQTGGTGSTDGQTVLYNGLTTYPTSWGWFMTVTNAGSFTYELRSEYITAVASLHVLRANGGSIALAGSAAWDDTDNADNGFSYSLNYSFSTNLSGAVLIEAISARTDLVSEPATYTEEINGSDKRVIASHTAVSGTSWSSAYTLSGGDVDKQTSGALGMIFTEGEGAEPPPTVSPYEGTNVLFIAIDDINPILGSFGNTLIQTPNMDRLAERGTVFLNAHCQWAVCGPSRASLMTGLMPEQTGVMGFTKMRGDAVNDDRDNARGVTNIVTIPQLFIEYGYETAAVGKINDNRCVGSINPDGTINEDGYSVDDPPSWSYGFENPPGVGSTTAVRTNDGVTVKLAAESVDQPATDFIDGAIATGGLSLLNTLAAGSKPFFLGVGFKKPHLPFLAPKSSWDLYDRDDFNPAPFPYAMANATPYTFNSVTELRNSYYLETDSSGNALQLTFDILPDEQQKLLRHGYYACISHVDEQIGRLLDELDALGLASNTIIVLWGDHGFHLGDHNEWGKHTNLEQATRVPFIISAPGYLPGQVSTAPVGLLDIFPTLCELSGIPEPVQPPNSVDPNDRPLSGRSLVPILQDASAHVQTGIMNHYGSGTYGYAYRTDRYRYTEWIDSSGVIQARELYDYELDPLETVNLADEPGYEGLIYQFSRSMRNADEAHGCDRLKSSAPAAATSANLTLRGIELQNGQISWPDAAGVSWNLMSTSNLTSGTWTTKQTGITAPIIMPTPDPQRFYRVDVVQ